MDIFNKIGLLLQIEKLYFVEFKYLYKPEPLNLIAKYLNQKYIFPKNA